MTTQNAPLLVGLVVGLLLAYELRKKDEAERRTGNPILAAIYTAILVLTFSDQAHQVLRQADAVAAPRLAQAWQRIVAATK